MKRSRFSEEQIIGILKEHEAGVSVADLCRKHGVSDASIYKWKAKFDGMEVSEAKRLKTLEDENGRLKRMLADAMLDNAALKDLLGKSGDARRTTRGSDAVASGLSDERAAGFPGDRDRPRQRALQSCASRGWRIARAAESLGAAATAVRLSAPVRAAAERRPGRQQEAGAAALPRRASDGSPPRRTQAGAWNAAAARGAGET